MFFTVPIFLVNLGINNITNTIANRDKKAANNTAAFCEKYFDSCPPTKGPMTIPAP